MSEVSTSSTPKRQAIVDRLRQRIESFRQHHDNCLARLEETQPSRELKEQEETQLLHIKFLENKVKMNPKIRLDQVGKMSKQGVNNVGKTKAANAVGQVILFQTSLNHDEVKVTFILNLLLKIKFTHCSLVHMDVQV